jgi:hypothetical protein
MHTESQNAQILKWLQGGQTLTALEALKHFQCFRLAARIADLKEAGHPILSTMIEVGEEKKRVAQYRINTI